jgi:hypothetical protein
MWQARRSRKAATVSLHLRHDLLHWRVEEWLLNCARNANSPTPVASAITTEKVNAPKRLASMSWLNHVTSHRKTRKIEVC